MAYSTNILSPWKSRCTIESANLFYIIGGTLPIDASSYVTRQADADLFEGLQQGEFCYVLNTRQMGKSSLMIRAARRLRAEGRRVVVLDLTAIGKNLTVEQWYGGLLVRLAQQTEQSDALLDFWSSHTNLGPMQRLIEALRETLLTPGAGPGAKIVIFLDEIDMVRSLPFSADEFFAGIRECYNRRSTDPAFENLTFCLLGVATPSDLIQDTRISPFNIGRRIELRDFTSEEAEPLASGLLPGLAQGADAPAATLYARLDPRALRLLKRTLHWTGGHPYMTQRLCRAVAERLAAQETKPQDVEDELEDSALVDAECERFFLCKTARETDDNLAFARNRLLFSEAERVAVLELYRKIRLGRRVLDDESNHLCGILRLSGIVAAESGVLRLRNRIYQQIFDLQWIASHLPDAELRRQRQAYRLGMLRAASISAVVLAVVAVFAGVAFKSAKVALRAGEKATQQEKIANIRLSHLYVETGTRLMEAGDDAAALAPLAEAMELDKADAARSSLHRIRFASALARSPKIERLWFTDAPVRWAAYSPDKRWVVAASEDGRAHIWDVAAGAELPLNIRHQGAITDAAFSPDGTRLVTCGTDGCGRVWDLRGRCLQWTLSPIALSGNQEGGHVAWSRDGQHIATCAYSLFSVWDVSGAAREGNSPAQGSLALASARNGSRIAPRLMEARVPTAHFTQSVFSEDGKNLTVIAANYLAQTVRIPTGDTSVSFALYGRSSESFRRDRAAGRPHEFAACFTGRQAAISPDGKWLAIAGAFDGKATRRGACVFDAQTGRAGKLLPHKGIATYVVFSPDARRVATASEDHTAQIWNAADSRPITPPLQHAGTVTRIEFSPDGQRVVTASADGTARVWDARTGQMIGSPLRHAGAVTMAQFGADSSHVMTAGQDGTVRLWTLPSILPASIRFSDYPCNFSLQANDTRIFEISFGPHPVSSANTREIGSVCDLDTGTRLLSLRQRRFTDHVELVPCAGGSQCILWRYGGRGILMQDAQLWDTRLGKPLSPILRADSIALSQPLKDGTMLYLRMKNEIWAVESMTGRRLKTLSTRADARTSLLQLTPDNRNLLFSDAQNALHLVDVDTGKDRTLPMQQESPTTFAEFSPDGHWLVTITLTGRTRIWRITDGLRDTSTAYAFEHPDDDSGPHVVFSPNSKYAIVVRGDGTTLWSLSGTGPLTPHVISRSRLDYEQGQFGFSPDNRYYFALHVGTQLGNADTAALVTPPLNPGGKVLCLAFSPDSQRVLSGSEDGSARIWDARSATPLTLPMLHEGNVWRAVFSRDGQTIATGTEDGVVRIWDASTGEALTPPWIISGTGTDRHVTNLEFTGDGRAIVASSYAGGHCWKLPRTSESLPRLQALAQLLSGQHYDVPAGMVPLDAASLRVAWKRYQQP